MKNVNYLFVILVCLSACYSGTRLSSYNLAGEYDISHARAGMKVVAYNSTDTSTTLYFRVQYDDLLYQRSNPASSWNARFVISCDLLSDVHARQPLVSKNMQCMDTLHYRQHGALDSTMEISLPDSGQYIVRMSLWDEYRKTRSVRLVELSRGQINSRNNFLVVDALGKPVYEDFIQDGKQYRINTRHRDYSTLYVRYYRRNFPVAKPPFAQRELTLFDYKADSIYAIPLLSGQTELLNFGSRGFYHLQLDSGTNRLGHTLFHFAKGYPQFASCNEMQQCLRYIVTNKEYLSIRKSSRCKVALDSFWLDKGGSTTRASHMLKKYYGRVQAANCYFNSYLEGWKSDRGMIYIIFGAPNVVYRSKYSEEWIYGEVGNINSMRFVFSRVDNPFTTNDYNLQRSPELKQPWYIAVNAWRR